MQKWDLLVEIHIQSWIEACYIKVNEGKLEPKSGTYREERPDVNTNGEYQCAG